MSARMVLRAIATLLALFSTASAFSAALLVSKSSLVVSDPQGNLLPKAVPGAEVDYTINVTNPTANALSSVNGVTFFDAIPPNTILKVTDYGLLTSGPVAFTPGLSTLAYGFTSFGSDTNSLSFSADNGATWSYRPLPDAAGYDARVTNIRIVATGAHLSGTSFSIRFRVKVK